MVPPETTILGKFMNYYFYKTTNMINGKIYYGVHQTNKLNDGYLGSGTAFKKAINKYGKENFQKEILFHFESADEMYEYEKEFINEEVIADRMTYNLTIGGKGVFSHIDSAGEKNCMKKPEIVKRVVEKRRENGSYHTPKTIESRKRATSASAIANTGKKRPKHSEFMKIWAKNDWVENKEKYRDQRSSTFKITSPSGETFISNRLEDFCKNLNLGYTSLWNSSNKKKAVTKGKSKGWICEKITTTVEIE